MKEEIEETQSELDCVKRMLEQTWNWTKADLSPEKYVKEILKFAIKTTGEAIQIAVTAQRTLDMLERIEKEREDK